MSFISVSGAPGISHRQGNLLFPGNTGAKACVGGPVWTQRVIPSGKWNAVAFNGASRYVAGGGNSGTSAAVAGASLDSGASWTGSGTPPNYSGNLFPVAPRGIAFGNGIFVAFGSFVDVSTSVDGLIWVNANHTPFFQITAGIAFGLGLFVVLESNTTNAYSSVDGINWSTNVLPGVNTNWSGIGFGNGRFIGVTSNAQTTVISLNGTAWVAGGVVPGGLTNCSKPVYGNSTWVIMRSAVGCTEFGYSKDNGVTWLTSNSFPAPASTWSDMIFADGVFLVVGTSGQNVMTSVDGITWVVATNLLPVAVDHFWSLATDGLGKYVAVAAVAGGTTIAASGQC